MKTRISFLLLLLVITGQFATASVADDRLRIYTVNYPLAYFAERVGGDLVKGALPVPQDVDPAFWNPSAEEVAAFQAADLILLNGATYAKWVPKVTLPRSRLVDTSASFADRYILIEDAATGRHGRGRHLALILSMSLYSYLIGYMLAEQPTHRPEPAMLFAIAMAAHVLGLNYEVRRTDTESFDRLFRYFLVLSVVTGWLTGVYLEMSDAVYSLWFAFLAGGIVSAGVATELPRVRTRGSFFIFTAGAVLFCALILLAEAYQT